LQVNFHNRYHLRINVNVSFEVISKPAHVISSA